MYWVCWMCRASAMKVFHLFFWFLVSGQSLQNVSRCPLFSRTRDFGPTVEASGIDAFDAYMCDSILVCADCPCSDRCFSPRGQCLMIKIHCKRNAVLGFGLSVQTLWHPLLPRTTRSKHARLHLGMRRLPVQRPLFWALNSGVPCS